MDQPIADALAASCAESAADVGPVEGIMTPILDPVQEREEIRCPATTVAYKSPSGSLFPWKLVLHLLKTCI
ncbi:Fad dependent oxidoreductase [Mycena sanguinolenta]|uniref:Fad dependent oxidoreductase n=1 Tax=Mycena sanguinolenta TaxID=230812 RepID=A0A8H7DJT1_9AGAR|nr:Fad dependent oxidoreductase [Mycena sanguinolenta]